MIRYGNIFKSHILGCPCVMISSPEAAKVVLVSQAHLFKPTYPPTKEKMIGPEALFFHQGHYHFTLKKLVRASFLPSAIRGLVPAIENIALHLLSKWENTAHVCTLQHMKMVIYNNRKYIYFNINNQLTTIYTNWFSLIIFVFQYSFEVAMISAFGYNPEPETHGIKCLYQTLEKGYNSMPLNFPGTPFHKAMKVKSCVHTSSFSFFNLCFEFHSINSESKLNGMYKLVPLV